MAGKELWLGVSLGMDKGRVIGWMHSGELQRPGGLVEVANGQADSKERKGRGGMCRSTSERAGEGQQQQDMASEGKWWAGTEWESRGGAAVAGHDIRGEVVSWYRVAGQCPRAPA